VQRENETELDEQSSVFISRHYKKISRRSKKGRDRLYLRDRKGLLKRADHRETPNSAVSKIHRDRGGTSIFLANLKGSLGGVNPD